MKVASDECAMGDDCYCPEGARWFQNKTHPPRDWEPSKDHYPTLKSREGTLEPGNVRLMHVHCNRVDYSNLALEAHLLSLRDEGERPLDDRAVDLAMETHLQLLAENNGRLPKGRKPWKAAEREARQLHEGIRGREEAPTQTPHLERWRARSTDALRKEARRVSDTNAAPKKASSPWEQWQRFVEWEKSIPDRFDPILAEQFSDYNVHHLIYDASPAEVRRLFEGDVIEGNASQE